MWIISHCLGLGHETMICVAWPELEFVLCMLVSFTANQMWTHPQKDKHVLRLTQSYNSIFWTRHSSGSSLCFMIPFYEYLNAPTVSLQDQKSIDLIRWSLLTQLYSVGWLSLVHIMDVTSHCLYQCRFIVSCDWSGFLCIKTLFFRHYCVDISSSAGPKSGGKH